MAKVEGYAIMLRLADDLSQAETHENVSMQNVVLGRFFKKGMWSRLDPVAAGCTEVMDLECLLLNNRDALSNREV